MDHPVGLLLFELELRHLFVLPHLPGVHIMEEVVEAIWSVAALDQLLRNSSIRAERRGEIIWVSLRLLLLDSLPHDFNLKVTG